MASGVDTHTHTHILWRNESDFKKPGAPGQRAPGQRAPGLKICFLAQVRVIPAKCWLQANPYMHSTCVTIISIKYQLHIKTLLRWSDTAPAIKEKCQVSRKPLLFQLRIHLFYFYVMKNMPSNEKLKLKR